MPNNVELPVCRQCPTRQFELTPVKQSRFMAICHATENVLEPVFPDLKSVFLSKATLSLASFEPVDNCPHLQQLRNDHTIPWAITLADFTK